MDRHPKGSNCDSNGYTEQVTLTDLLLEAGQASHPQDLASAACNAVRRRLSRFDGSVRNIDIFWLTFSPAAYMFW